MATIRYGIDMSQEMSPNARRRLNRDWHHFNPLFPGLGDYKTQTGRKLNPTERMLIGVIWDASTLKYGYMCKAYKTLADEMGSGETAIRDAFKTLLSEGLIEEIPEDQRVDARAYTGVRAFQPTFTLEVLVSDLPTNSAVEGLTPSEIRTPPGTNFASPPGTNFEPKELELKTQVKTFSGKSDSTPKSDNQGRARKSSQFAGAGRNAKAIQQQMELEEDAPGSDSRARTTPHPVAPRPSIASRANGGPIRVEVVAQPRRSNPGNPGVENRGLGAVDAEGNIKI